jgi:O-antigen ligase
MNLSETQNNRAKYLLSGIVFTILFSLAYVNALGISYRSAIVIFGGSVMFLVTAIYLRNLRSLLLFMLVFVVPIQFGYHLLHTTLTIESQPFSAGIAIDSMDVFLAALYADWLLNGSQRKRDVSGPVIGGSIGVTLLIWIVYVACVSFVKAVRPEFSLFEIIVLFKGFLLFFYLVNNINTIEEAKIIFYSFFAVTVVHSLFMIAQFLMGVNYTAHGKIAAWVGPEGFRSAGFIGSPDASSVAVTLAYPMILLYMLLSDTRSRRFWVGLGLAVVLTAIAFTKVRSAWIAMLLSTPTALYLAYSRKWIALRTIGKVFFGALIILAVASPYIAYRFEKGSLGEDRLPLVETAWNMIKDNFVFGVGVNNYPFDIQKYLPVSARHQWEYTVHNEYLLRIAETGIIGASLYYSLMLLVLIRLKRLTNSKSAWIFIMSAGLFAALIGSIPHRMFSFYHYISAYLQVCVIMALAYILKKLDKKYFGSGISTETKRI